MIWTNAVFVNFVLESLVKAMRGVAGRQVMVKASLLGRSPLAPL